jgi:hypothetical protein
MGRVLFLLATAVLLTVRSSPVEAGSIIFKNDCFEAEQPTVCNDPGGVITVHSDPSGAEFFTLTDGTIDQVFPPDFDFSLVVLGPNFVFGVFPQTDCGRNGFFGCLNITSGNKIGATMPLVDGSGQPFFRTVYDAGVFDIQGIVGPPIAGTLISGVVGRFFFDLYPDLGVGQIEAFDLAGTLQPDLAAAFGVNPGVLVGFDLNFFLEGGAVTKNLVTVDAAPIPEPATGLLVATALGIAGFRRAHRLSR